MSKVSKTVIIGIDISGTVVKGALVELEEKPQVRKLCNYGAAQNALNHVIK